MRKETLVFLTSLAIIFIIGYVNMTILPENGLNEEDYANVGTVNEEINGAQLVEVLEQVDTTDMAVNKPLDVPTIAEVEEDVKGVHEEEVAKAEDKTEIAKEEPAKQTSTLEEAAITEVVEDDLDYVILGDITNILEKDSVAANSNGVLDMINSNFANFKINKEKGNQDVIDHLEKSISNASISVDTKNQFESLLLNKTEFVKKEVDIELMLQTKGYNKTLVIVDEDMVKVVSNDTIEQADATKILDVIVSETNYEPSQIKIVKFDNIDL